MAPDVEAGEGGDAKPSMRSRAEAAANQGRERGAGKLAEMEGGEGLADLVGGGDAGVLRVLLVIVPCQYLAWYFAAATLSLAFGVTGDSFIITFVEPFDHINFTPMVEGGAWKPLVNWLSTVLTLTLVSPWLIYFGCRPAKDRATDCSTAMQALHFFLATTVTRQTPENWIWWATVMPCSVFMGKVAQFMITHLKQQRKDRRRGRPTTPYNKSRG